MKFKPTVLIEVNSGCVQNVSSNCGVDVFVLDYDDVNTVDKIPQEKGCDVPGRAWKEPTTLLSEKFLNTVTKAIKRCNQKVVGAGAKNRRQS